MTTTHLTTYPKHTSSNKNYALSPFCPLYIVFLFQKSSWNACWVFQVNLFSWAHNILFPLSPQCLNTNFPFFGNYTKDLMHFFCLKLHLGHIWQKQFWNYAWKYTDECRKNTHSSFIIVSGMLPLAAVQAPAANSAAVILLRHRSSSSTEWAPRFESPDPVQINQDTCHMDTAFPGRNLMQPF